MSAWKHAFALSKEQVAEAEPPGTDRLIEHATGDTIQLTPQPSSSPYDPLNNPQWRKFAILTVLSVYCGCANFGSASVAPALPVLGPVFPGKSVSQLIAVNVLCIGSSNIFWVPMANTFGRRGVLIAAMALSVATSIWCAQAQGWGSLLAARAVQGFAFGPADSLAASVVGEVFFVHERGRAMAFYTIFLSGGSFVGGLAGGYIAGIQGYRWIFWIHVVLFVICLIAMILVVPETGFDREAAMRADIDSINEGSVLDDEKRANVSAIERMASRPQPQTLSYMESLKVGVYHGHIARNFAAPWLSLLFPGTWVVMLHYGGLLGGLVTISTIGPALLAAPPYLWGNNAGLVNIGGILGCLLGGISTYLIVDRMTTASARKTSHGLSEPESRLPAMFPALFIATTGLWVFGFCAANPGGLRWVGLAVGYGMVGFGITQVPSVGFNYLIDAYYPIAADCMVMTTIMRAVVSFAWTFFVSEWIAKDGAMIPFGIFGMLMGIFGLLTVPLWVYGKRMRIATAGSLPKGD